MKNAIIFLLFIAAQAFAQSEPSVGDTENNGILLGVKYFDIGFSRSNYLNVVSCSRSQYIVVRWSGKFNRDVTGFEIALGVPKVELSPKNSGLIALDSLSYAATTGMNFTTPREIGNVRLYEIKTAGFNYVVQVFAVNKYGEILYRSQILYVKQK